MMSVMLLLLCNLAKLAGGALLSAPKSTFMPPRTTASRWTSDMVLCYMDGRSIGPTPQPAFEWDLTKFLRLLAYNDEPLDVGGGRPVDTLFDAFLMISYDWKNGTSMWPGHGTCCMNKTDWSEVRGSS